MKTRVLLLCCSLLAITSVLFVRPAIILGGETTTAVDFLRAHEKSFEAYFRRCMTTPWGGELDYLTLTYREAYQQAETLIRKHSKRVLQWAACDDRTLEPSFLFEHSIPYALEELESQNIQPNQLSKIRSLLQDSGPRATYALANVFSMLKRLDASYETYFTKMRADRSARRDDHLLLFPDDMDKLEKSVLFLLSDYYEGIGKYLLAMNAISASPAIEARSRLVERLSRVCEYLATLNFEEQPKAADTKNDEWNALRDFAQRETQDTYLRQSWPGVVEKYGRMLEEISRFDKAFEMLKSAPQLPDAITNAQDKRKVRHIRDLLHRAGASLNEVERLAYSIDEDLSQ